MEAGLALKGLPTLSDVVAFLAREDKIESVDFRSFYYQIGLHAEVRPFFRLQINGRLFQMRVLPQGACFSVQVAHKITSAIVHKLLVGNVQIPWKTRTPSGLHRQRLHRRFREVVEPCGDPLFD